METIFALRVAVKRLVADGHGSVMVVEDFTHDIRHEDLNITLDLRLLS